MYDGVCPYQWLHDCVKSSLSKVTDALNLSVLFQSVHTILVGPT